MQEQSAEPSSEPTTSTGDDDPLESSTSRTALRRTRRANARGGARGQQVHVRLTEAEAERLAELAAARSVTVPRLLVEAAFADPAATPAEYRERVRDLLAAQRVVGAAADNMNQIARKANTVHEVPSSFGLAIEELRGSVAAMSATMRALRQLLGEDPELEQVAAPGTAVSGSTSSPTSGPGPDSGADSAAEWGEQIDGPGPR